MSLEYVRGLSSIRYGIENYNNKVKCKVEDECYSTIKKHLIISLKKYNI